MVKNASFLMNMSNILVLIFSLGSSAILLPRFQRKIVDGGNESNCLATPLIPDDLNYQPVSQCDEYSEGLLSRLFFNFVSDIVKLIQTSDLRRVSLPPLGQIEDKHARAKFSLCCQEVSGRGPTALGWAIVKWGAAYLSVATILEALQTTLQILSPLILNRILNLLQSRDLYTSSQFR